MGKAYTDQVLRGNWCKRGQDWPVDLETGIIQFGEDAFSMQLLDSEL